MDEVTSPTPPVMRHARALLLVNGETPAQILRKRLVQEGCLADGTTLRLNAFVNHQVDCMLVSEPCRLTHVSERFAQPAFDH